MSLVACGNYQTASFRVVNSATGDPVKNAKFDTEFIDGSLCHYRISLGQIGLTPSHKKISRMMREWPMSEFRSEGQLGSV